MDSHLPDDNRCSQWPVLHGWKIDETAFRTITPYKQTRAMTQRSDSSSFGASSPDSEAWPSSSSLAPRYNNSLLVGPSGPVDLPSEHTFDFAHPVDFPAYPSAPAPLQTHVQNVPRPDAVQPRPAKKRRLLPPTSAESSSKASSSSQAGPLSARSNKPNQFVLQRRSKSLAAKTCAPTTSRKRKHREENDENAPPVSYGQQADEGELVLWDVLRKKKVQCNRERHCRFRAQGCPWTFDSVRDLKRHEKDRPHSDDRKAMKCAPVKLYHCPWPGCDYASQRDYCLKAHWKAVTRGCVKHLIEDQRWPYESLEGLHQHLREHPAHLQCPEF